MREICMDVANQLEEVANSGEDFDEDPPLRIPAPQRFVAAVQASVTAAEALGMPNDDSSRLDLYCCFFIYVIQYNGHTEENLRYKPLMAIQSMRKFLTKAVTCCFQSSASTAIARK